MDIILFSAINPLSLRDCVAISKIIENLMLNLVQHLIKSNGYVTLI